MGDKKASSVIVGHTAVPSRIWMWTRRFCTLRIVLPVKIRQEGDNRN